MQEFSVSPREMVGSFWRNRNLINMMVRREVLGRYRGSLLGILWSFFNPVFMLAVYTFMFSTVFNARWNAASESKVEFALVLFVGLMIFNLFAECILKAPGTILANVNYVKKVVFPLEILPWVTLGAALFHGLVSLGVWLAASLILVGPPPASAVLLPLVLVPLVLLIMGISWALAALGVYLRDVSQVIGVVTTGLLFLSPVFYPASAMPREYRHLLLLNPLTPAIEQARDVLYWGRLVDPRLFSLSCVAGALIAWLGFAWFQKTRRGFADVL
jgi:lipopolysaccharide transport system permease protein